KLTCLAPPAARTPPPPRTGSPSRAAGLNWRAAESRGQRTRSPVLKLLGWVAPDGPAIAEGQALLVREPDGQRSQEPQDELPPRPPLQAVDPPDLVALAGHLLAFHPEPAHYRGGRLPLQPGLVDGERRQEGKGGEGSHAHEEEQGR